MKKVMVDLAVIPDGYIEGANGEIDWRIMEEEMCFSDFLSQIDHIFYGRISYEAWGQYLPAEVEDTSAHACWKKLHEKQKQVFSRTKQGEGATWFREVS